MKNAILLLCSFTLILAYQNCGGGTKDTQEEPVVETSETSPFKPPLADNSGGDCQTGDPDYYTTCGNAGFEVAKAISGGNDSLSLSATINFSSQHIGRAVAVYVAAEMPDGRWFFLSNYVKDADGLLREKWEAYSANFAPLPYRISLALPAEAQIIGILPGVDVRDLVGTKIYVGYGHLTDGFAPDPEFPLYNPIRFFGYMWNEMIENSRYKLIHTIE